MKNLNSYLREYTSEEKIKEYIVGGLTVLSAFLVRRMVYTLWKYTTNKEPPLNPASRKVSWQEAFVFTVLTGVMASIARLIVMRNVSLGIDEDPDD
ncbi:DUF4235 domain-containing protein [Catalinimonas niigatensis]|uniref:DUF4235 domain-containing protein n=1 Tax=Catalinimonas niigatensis TaxID=1397264 RepID=UPI002666A218|nr:DUF4235 domain-containing protein [Catalinimonas niigatensis]WPP52052.1 DUF4235 domain-containing protein [Catalinimonas niigatensis]